MDEIEFLEIFSKNLVDLMKERRYTQKDLADDSHLSVGTVSNYINGKQMPTIKAAVNLSNCLDCDLDELIPTFDLVK